MNTKTLAAQSRRQWHPKVSVPERTGQRCRSIGWNNNSRNRVEKTLIESFVSQLIGDFSSLFTEAFCFCHGLESRNETPHVQSASGQCESCAEFLDSSSVVRLIVGERTE